MQKTNSTLKSNEILEKILNDQLFFEIIQGVAFHNFRWLGTVKLLLRKR